MIAILIVMLASLAGAGPITEELSDGVVVDWSRQVLRVQASATRRGTESTEAVEQKVRRDVEAAVQLAAPRVRVHGPNTLADLLTDDALGPALRSRLSGWAVTEATYDASGSVALAAELPLYDVLKPWALSVARAEPGSDVREHTGVVLDARGIGAQAVYAPELRAPDASVLWAGVLREEQALERPPAVFVGDPADRAAGRAGERPLFLVASASSGTTLTLDEASTRLLATSADGTALLERGTLVVVLDP